MKKLTKNLKVALLKEKIEKATGKKVILKEAAPVNIIDKAKTKAAGNTEEELKILAKNIIDMQNTLEAKLEPFRQQMDLLNQQMSDAEGETPTLINSIHKRIEDLMKESKIETLTIKNKCQLILESNTVKSTIKYANIVNKINALEGYRKAFGVLHDAIIQEGIELANTEAKKREKQSLTINPLEEGIVGDIWNKIKGLAARVARAFMDVVSTGKVALQALSDIPDTKTPTQQVVTENKKIKTMATSREKQLAITLLKERIEHATGKKIVFLEGSGIATLDQDKGTPPGGSSVQTPAAGGKMIQEAAGAVSQTDLTALWNNGGRTFFDSFKILKDKLDSYRSLNNLPEGITSKDIINVNHVLEVLAPQIVQAAQAIK